MTTLTNQYGYKDQQGTELSEEILASSRYEMISITIDSATRDTGNTGQTENLRRGLVLYYDTTDKRYKELTLAAQSPRAVVLGEPVPNMDQVTDHIVAKAYYKGTFKKGKIYDDSGNFDLDQCQRISERDNVGVGT